MPLPEPPIASIGNRHPFLVAFRSARFRFRLRTVSHVELPAEKGSTFHGAGFEATSAPLLSFPLRTHERRGRPGLAPQRPTAPLRAPATARDHHGIPRGLEALPGADFVRSCHRAALRLPRGPRQARIDRDRAEPRYRAPRRNGSSRICAICRSIDGSSIGSPTPSPPLGGGITHWSADISSPPHGRGLRGGRSKIIVSFNRAPRKPYRNAYSLARPRPRRSAAYPRRGGSIVYRPSPKLVFPPMCIHSPSASQGRNGVRSPR